MTIGRTDRPARGLGGLVALAAGLVEDSFGLAAHRLARILEGGRGGTLLLTGLARSVVRLDVLLVRGPGPVRGLDALRVQVDGLPGLILRPGHGLRVGGQRLRRVLAR